MRPETFLVWFAWTWLALVLAYTAGGGIHWVLTRLTKGENR